MICDFDRVQPTDGPLTSAGLLHLFYTYNIYVYDIMEQGEGDPTMILHLLTRPFSNRVNF